MSWHRIGSGRAWCAAVAAAVTAGVPLVLTAPAAAAPPWEEGYVLTGTVVDGSGHGWPLPAQVRAGDDGPTVATDPVTGRYRLPVPSRGDYEVTVEPGYPGYTSVTVPVTGGSTRLDVDVPVDAEHCVAPGYTAMHERFDGGVLPDGWEVQDHGGSGQVWELDNPGGRTNNTGGQGGFAIVDSWNWGSGGEQDTSLVSAPLDLRSVAAPTLELATEFRTSGFERAEIDVSLDGGQTWTSVWRHWFGNLLGPRTLTVPLPQAAGHDDVRVRWHYYVGSGDWWWQVDDVVVRDASCRPVAGGLVAGEVSDAVTGDALAGARVSVDGVGGAVTTADASGAGVGRYAVFSQRMGDATVTAGMDEYVGASQQVRVVEGKVARADLELDAGRLELQETQLSDSVPVGATREQPFRVTNTGTAPATFELRTRDRGFTVQAPDGDAGPAGAAGAAGPVPATRAAPAAWEGVPDYPIAIADNAGGSHDGRIYSFGGAAGSGTTDRGFAFDPATGVWTETAPMPTGREAMSGTFVDGRFVAVGGYSDNRKAVEPAAVSYDPAADAWTTGATSPAPRAAAGTALLDGDIVTVGGCDATTCGHTDVLAYDVTLDEFTRLADYPEPVAWAACAAATGRVYCSGGTGPDGSETRSGYEYDPATDAWAPIANAPRAFWGAGAVAADQQIVVAGGLSGRAATQQAWLYDPWGDTWEPLPTTLGARGRGALVCGVYRIGGTDGSYPGRKVETLPGFDRCADASPASGWLSPDRTVATLAPGESVTVQVTLDATATDQPGTHRARLRVLEDTPYEVGGVDVAMTATVHRSWKPLVGTVSGQACDGTVEPLDRVAVVVQGRDDRWVHVTGRDGRFLRWTGPGDRLVTLIVGLDGYAPLTREVRVGAGAAHDITLTETGCR